MSEHRAGAAPGRLPTGLAIALALGTAVLLWLAPDVLLIAFAGILLAVGLDGLASALAGRTRLGRGWALAVVVAGFVLIAALAAAFMIPQFIQQLEQLVEQIEVFVGDAQRFIREHGFAGDGEDTTGTVLEAAGQAALATLTVLGAVASLGLIVVLGLFMAADPALYRDGALSLVPRHHRGRIDRTFSAVAHALRWWLLGQLVSMTVLAVVTSTMLLLLGVQLWLALGVVTGILTFVPFLGPIIAGALVIVASLPQGLETVIYVFILFVVLQSFEGYFLTPMIQQRAVHMAPALMIAMQVLGGALFGVLGFVLAAPLTAAGMVAVNLLYVEEVVGEPAQLA